MQTQTGVGYVKPFGLRMPDDLKEWAAAQARKEHSSLNAWLLRLMEEKREATRHAQAA